MLGLFSAGSAAFAGSETENKASFDQSVYGIAENYDYDKFDKTWDVYAAYSKKYSDAVVVLGLKVWGDTDAIRQPHYLYLWVWEANNVDTKWTITGLQLIVDEVVYSAKTLFVADSQSTMILDSSAGKELLTAIAGADELAFKKIFSTGSHVEEITGEDYTEIKELAKLIVENDAWAFVLDSDGNDMTAWDTFINKNYPIEINK